MPIQALPSAAQLVLPTGISRETLLVGDRLSIGTIEGEIIGVAIAIFYRGRRYSVEVAGAAQSDPAWALGVVELLKAELVDTAQRQAFAATTIT